MVLDSDAVYKEEKKHTHTRTEKACGLDAALALLPKTD